MSFTITPQTKSVKLKGAVKGVKNLQVAGQWAHTPGGLPVAVTSGKFAVQRILKSLKRDIITKEALLSELVKMGAEGTKSVENCPANEPELFFEKFSDDLFAYAVFLLLFLIVTQIVTQHNPITIYRKEKLYYRHNKSNLPLGSGCFYIYRNYSKSRKNFSLFFLCYVLTIWFVLTIHSCNLKFI